MVPDNDQPNPTPSEATIRLVCAYLNQRRLLTTELYVIPPSYVRVDTEVHLTVSPLADLAAVTEAAQTALDDYFHPLRGGEDGLGWPFGGTIFFSRVYQRLLSISGVARVDSVADHSRRRNRSRLHKRTDPARRRCSTRARTK